MKTFNVNRLHSLTKSMYESYQRWGDRNWKDTLKKHHRKIERFLEKIQVFDLWSNMLGRRYENVAIKLLPEILMDANISVHFACMGLYKQSNVCLRAQLETALRLVYFSTHPVEFKWWHDGKTEYFKNKDVWVEDFVYFRRLEDVKKFQKKYAESGHNLILFEKVGRLYGKLSQYVHSGVSSFQTRPERFSPTYKDKEFGEWVDSFKDAQKYIHTILVLGFSEDFKNMTENRQKNILRAIEDNNFKLALRRSLVPKMRGRI